MIKYVKDFTEEPRDFYVYTHHRLSDGRIFYVGKGKCGRYQQFTKRSDWWKRIANKYGVFIKIHLDGLREYYALELEIDMIAFYGRMDRGTGCLINLTDGGDGTSGHIRSRETIEKIASKHRGTKRSKEFCDRLKASWKPRKCNYDKNIYNFMNISTREVINSTRVDFEKLYNVTTNTLFCKTGNITNLNWTVLPDCYTVDSYIKYITQRKLTKQYDKQYYSFMNSDGTKFKGTRRELAVTFNVCLTQLNTLFKKIRPRKTVKGWSLLKESDGS